MTFVDYPPGWTCERVTIRFERYLRLSIHMFESGNCDLLQIHLRRIDRPRPTQQGDRS